MWWKMRRNETIFSGDFKTSHHRRNIDCRLFQSMSFLLLSLHRVFAKSSGILIVISSCCDCDYSRTILWLERGMNSSFGAVQRDAIDVDRATPVRVQCEAQDCRALLEVSVLLSIPWYCLLQRQSCRQNCEQGFLFVGECESWTEIGQTCYCTLRKLQTVRCTSNVV